MELSDGSLNSGRKHTKLAVDHDTCPWGPAQFRVVRQRKARCRRCARKPCPLPRDDTPEPRPRAQKGRPRGGASKRAEENVEATATLSLTREDLQAFKAKVADQMLDMGRSEDDIMAALNTQTPNSKSKKNSARRNVRQILGALRRGRKTRAKSRAQASRAFFSTTTESKAQPCIISSFEK